MSNISDRIDHMAMLCLDAGLALRTLYVPVKSLRDLLAQSTAQSPYDIVGLGTIFGKWRWLSCAGHVEVLCHDGGLSQYLSIDSNGMVTCGLDSAPTLMLLNKLLRLKVYDPSPV